MDVPQWFDEHHPHDAERSAAQIEVLTQRLRGRSARVLDLGCGSGRVLVPLARAGHDVVGVDRHKAVIDSCRASLDQMNAAATLVHGDFFALPELLESCGIGPAFDAVLCLGNTIMTLADVDAAVELLAHARKALRRGGELIIDDVCFDFWPELTDGRWQSGVSDEDDPRAVLQMIWSPGDAVFTLRSGNQVNPHNWTIGAEEQRYRLWSLGALRLAARLAGLSGPQHDAPGALLVFTVDGSD